MTDENTDSVSEEQIKDKVHSILEDGNKVREGVHDLVLTFLKDAQMEVSKVQSQVGKVVESTGSFIKTQGESVSPKAFSEVMDGIGDALESSMNAVTFSLKEAKGKGEKFASDELSKFSGEIGGLFDLLSETVQNAAKEVGEEGKEFADAFSEHFGNTKERVTPALNDLLRAIKDHPVDAATGAAGSVLNAVGSALSALGKKIGD